MKLFLETKDYAVTGEPFQLLYNEEFDLLETRPQPKDLARYYDSSSYISHTDANNSLVDKAYQWVKRYSLSRKVRLINEYAKNNKKVLDIGAGTGDFLVAAKKAQWSVAGVEPNRMARGKASEKKVTLVPTLDELPSKAYQVITLWHVMEHLPNLNNEIEKIVQLLEEEGSLFVAVPNFNSWDAKHYKSHWAGYDVPRHLWHFSRTAVSRIFEKHSLKVVETKPMIFDSFYVSLLSEQYRKSNWQKVAAFVNGLRSNLSALQTKEYSSLLYILQKA